MSRVVARQGLPKLAVLDPITAEVIRASKVTAIRYERDRPGELVHMDVKKLGRISHGGGWRVHGPWLVRAVVGRLHRHTGIIASNKAQILWNRRGPADRGTDL